MDATVLVSTSKLTREEWLTYRRQGIGGSDVAAILGLSKWGSPLSVYKDKTSEEPPVDTENDAMHFGTVLEAVVADEFARRTGMKVQRKNAILQSKEHPWMLVNLDRVVTEPDGTKVPLECKTANAFAKKDWQDGVPRYYLPQCMHEMAVYGGDHMWVACLIGGQDFVIHRLERDDDMLERIIEAERRFWYDHVVPRIPPSDTSEDVLKLIPAKPESSIDLPSNAHEALEAYLMASVDEGEAKARKEAAGNLLRAMLGENETGVLDGVRRVEWTGYSVTRFDAKALEAADPATYERFCKTSSQRRLNIL